jgi:hypothetical protein
MLINTPGSVNESELYKLSKFLIKSFKLSAISLKLIFSSNLAFFDLKKSLNASIYLFFQTLNHLFKLNYLYQNNTCSSGETSQKTGISF